MDFRALGPLETLNLSAFKEILTILYPAHEVSSMGRRYFILGKNQFKNDYLRDIVSLKPNYVEYLNVCAEPEFIKEPINIDEAKFRDPINHDL